jgi:hypothetical protein
MGDSWVQRDLVYIILCLMLSYRCAESVQEVAATVDFKSAALRLS